MGHTVSGTSPLSEGATANTFGFGRRCLAFGIQRVCGPLLLIAATLIVVAVLSLTAYLAFAYLF